MPILFNQLQQKKIAWLLLVLLLLLIAWCANPWQLYFINDDFIDIPKTQGGHIGHHNSLRHINDLSLYFNYLTSNENAAGYHFTNLFLYCANILLAIPLLKRIAVSLSYQLSTRIVVAMAGLFGIYAFHSEALFWILCRTATFSFFFTILSWLCLFKSLQQRWWMLPMVILFLLGMFTYEAIWVFPFWLITWYFLLPENDKQRRAAILPICIIVVLFVTYFPLRLIATGELLGTYEANDIQQFHFLSIVGKSFKLFARSFLPPVENPKLFVGLFLLIASGLVIFGWQLWKKERKNKLLWFFVIAWLLSYFPYVSLGVSTRGYESDRYLYFPSFFLCAAVVYGVYLLWGNKSQRMLLFMGVIFLYQVFFFIRSSQVYKSIGSYSKSAIAAIQKIPLTRKIIIRHLPVYSNGLPVFNYGFSHAVVWLVPGRDTTDITVIDKTVFYKEHIAIIKDTTGPVADTLTFLGL